MICHKTKLDRSTEDRLTCACFSLKWRGGVAQTFAKYISYQQDSVQMSGEKSEMSEDREEWRKNQ